MAHAEVNYAPDPRSDEPIVPRRYGSLGNLHGPGDPNGVVNGRTGWSFYDDLTGNVYYNTGTGYSSVWTQQSVGGDTVEPPIGSIQPWHKSLTGVPSIPDGWVECNGQVLNDPESPLDGQTIPNLNGNDGGLFLRAGASSGTVNGSGSEDDTAVDNNGGGATVSVRTSFYEPPYFVAVMIMRVK